MAVDNYEHSKPSEEQLARMSAVREGARIYADILDKMLPPGPDKTYVFRQFRTAVMWANVAITRQPNGSARTTNPLPNA